MKRVLILIFFLSIFSTSCNSSKFGQSNKDTNITDNIAKQQLYGEWTVKREITSGPVTAYGEKELKEILANKIAYSADSVSINNESFDNPNYKFTKIDKNDFFQLTYVNLEDLDIKSDSITQVDITADNNSNFFGSLAYIKSRDTIIVFDRGGFFEMEKVQ